MQFAWTLLLDIVVRKGGTGKGIIVNSMIGQLSSRDEVGRDFVNAQIKHSSVAKPSTRLARNLAPSYVLKVAVFSAVSHIRSKATNNWHTWASINW